MNDSCARNGNHSAVAVKHNLDACYLIYALAAGIHISIRFTFLSTCMWKYFKFYVTGGVTNVQVQSVQTYDQNGNALSGVNATATAQSSPDNS